MAKKLVVSLLPGATEMIVACGAIDQLVGISHECDWPPDVRNLPRVTTTPIDPSRSSLEIHRDVQRAIAAGRSVIGIDANALTTLRPNVIITQELCDVCAVADGEAFQLAAIMPNPPEVLVLSGTTLSAVCNDLRKVGVALDHDAEGERAAASLEAAVGRFANTPLAHRPNVVAIEWLDPIFLAGHWVPEMIEAAGGHDIGAAPGSHSVVRSLDEVTALDPEVILVMLCGFDEARGRTEMANLRDPALKRWLDARQIAFIDGNAFTSRPGPRLIEGIRQMRTVFERLQ